MKANRDLLYQHVKFLTTLRPFRNYQNPESLEKVCRYLRGEFDKYGLAAVEQTFTAEGSDYKNVIFNQQVYELMKFDAGIDVEMIDHPSVESLAGMSDQRSYWEFDIPALMINDTSFIRNPNYHEMSDDIDTLSFDHMREVVTCAYRSITGF